MKVKSVLIGLAAAVLATPAAQGQAIHRELAEYTQILDEDAVQIFRGRYYPNSPVYGVFMLCLTDIDHEEDDGEVVVYSAGGYRQQLKEGACAFHATDFLSIGSDRGRRSAELRVRLIETGTASNAEAPPEPEADEQD